MPSETMTKPQYPWITLRIHFREISDLCGWCSGCHKNDFPNLTNESAEVVLREIQAFIDRHKSHRPEKPCP